jgi:A/G-specific adenine glycosylase
VASFAYRRRVAVLDTNVGRVLARALANRPLRAREAQHLADTLLARDARIFNQAMLDLGAQFCTKTPRCAPCPVRRQCRWRREGGDAPAPQSAAVTRPQARFVGSDRQVRGRLLRALGGGAMSRRALRDELRDVERPRLDRALERLREEGLVAVHGERVALNGDVVRAQ